MNVFPRLQSAEIGKNALQPMAPEVTGVQFLSRRHADAARFLGVADVVFRRIDACSGALSGYSTWCTFNRNQPGEIRIVRHVDRQVGKQQAAAAMISIPRGWLMVSSPLCGLMMELR